MSYENFPSADTPEEQPVVVKNNNNRNILTGILIVALLATWGYIIYDKNKTKQEKQDLPHKSLTAILLKMNCNGN